MNRFQEPSGLIKSNTAVAHAHTEKALMKHIKSIDTADDYAELLYCFYGYFAPVEKILATYGTSLLTDYDLRRKSGSILIDLQQLNVPNPKSFAVDLPIIKNKNQAMGCLYVLEGSILGGAILKKRILAQCPAIPVSAFSYFSGYDQQTPVMWQSFISQFNCFFNTNYSIEKAIDSANECFVKLENWIVKYFNSYPVATQAKQ